jgi:nitroreductase
MDAYEALITRASPVELCDPAPDEATEQKIIAAALRAPDHGRLRPWRFISIRGEGRAFLGGVLASALSRRDPNATEDALQRERKKPLRAPLVLVVAARIVESPKIPAIEQMLSAGAAAQNIMLASHALGFGALWKTGDPAYDAGVKEALGLQATDAIVGFLYIGTPKAMPKSPVPLNPWDFVRTWPSSSNTMA